MYGWDGLSFYFFETSPSAEVLEGEDSSSKLLTCVKNVFSCFRWDTFLIHLRL